MLARLPVTWTMDGTIDLITESTHPVLVACVRKDDKFQATLNKLEMVAEYFEGEMDVFFALEDMFTYFNRNYGISGTPTYLFLSRGTVLARILGKNSAHELIKRASCILLHHQDCGIGKSRRVRNPKHEQ